MTWLGQDVRYAIRRMRRTPGFTAAAIATLALGLGLNSAVTSLAYAVFVKPLPLDGADRLALVDQTLTGRSTQFGFPLSYPDYLYYRDHAHRFAELAAHYPTSPMHLATRESTFDVLGSVVTANYFNVLRLRPALGRFFETEEDRVPGRNPVAVISHDFWRNRLGGDAGIVGAEIRVNGMTFRVIGVAPEGFRGIVRGVPPSDVFIPTAMFRVGYRYCDGFARDCKVINLIGRLQPEASVRDAQAEMSVLASRLEATFPDQNRGRGVVVRPARGVRVDEQAQNAPIVRLLAAAAALVLLVAAANVAGLLLARGLRRRKEVAIRLALGASRGRVIRELLVESMLLAVAGGAAGLIVAVWATELLRRFFGVSYSGTIVNLDLSLHPAVVAISLVAAAVTGVLTGIAPALQTTRGQALPALKDEPTGASARRTRFRDGLIVCQVAMSVLLLVSSALLVRSFIRVHRGPGFDPDAIILLRLRPSLVGYGIDRAWTFQREALHRLEALPGVVAASPANVPPLPGWGKPRRPIRVAGDAGDNTQAFQSPTTYVGPRYFTTLGAGVVDGREFDDRDTPDGPRVAILNETLARRLFPRGGAVGSTITVGGKAHEIVGVSKDLQFVSAWDQAEPVAYLNFWQQDRTDNWSQDSQTHVRITGGAAATLSEIRRTIATIDPDVPVSDVMLLGERLNYAFGEVRAARALLVTFGTLALVLSAIGLYAALAFAVTQRSKEIAIRVALGAARGDVRSLVMRHGLMIVSIGAAIGIVAAAATGPLLAHLLYGVSPRDPFALIAGPIVLVAVACLAIWLPARRAMAVDPMIALRSE
ncbi:MAG TPA: ADOP family duplicated permease [Vicinamibacterales bacterium]|nr:ADOP family duplicated permease [Vicinamibacterales bacterium]